MDTVMIMGEVFMGGSGEFDFGNQKTTRRYSVQLFNCFYCFRLDDWTFKKLLH